MVKDRIFKDVFIKTLKKTINKIIINKNKYTIWILLNILIKNIFGIYKVIFMKVSYKNVMKKIYQNMNITF